MKHLNVKISDKTCLNKIWLAETKQIKLWFIWFILFSNLGLSQYTDTGMCYSVSFTNLTLYKGQVYFRPYFFDACNREDLNGDGITQDWSVLRTFDDSLYNWISFNGTYHTMTRLVPPQGKTRNTQFVRNGFFIDTKQLSAGNKYYFNGNVWSEISGGGIGVRLEVFGPPITLYVLSYPIEITSVSSPNGSYSTVNLSWNTPDIQYWSLDHYKIFRNELDSIRINELDSSVIVKNYISPNITSDYLSIGIRSVNSFYAVVGYDSSGEAIAISESFQADYQENNFGLLSPLDGQILNTLTPTLDWEDQPGAVEYTLWYSDDSSFATKTEISGIDSSEFTIQSPLQDNITYYWKVKTNDEIFCNETGWNFGTNLVNQQPGEIYLLEPNNGQTLNTKYPGFTWTESSDQGDKVIYEVIISSSSDFVDTVLIGQTNLTSFMDVNQFQDDITYYWKVKGIDSENLSAESNISYFTVDFDDIPTGFKLFYPTYNFEERPVETDLYPTFNWYSSSDPDGGSISYTLLYSTDSTFNSFTEVAGIVDTFYTVVEPLQEDRYYFWKVKAVDNQAVERWSYGLPYCFVTNENDKDPGEAPLTFPIDSRVVPPENLTLRWERPDDDIYDIHRYDLYYSTDSTFETGVEILDIQDTTSYLITELEPGQYYWKVFTRTHTLPSTAHGYPVPAGTSESVVHSFFVSNSFIKRLNYPYTGLELEASTICDIIWTSENVDSVKIELSSDGGMTWDVIVTELSGNIQTYSWRVPNNIGDNFRMKISDINNPNNYAMTEGDFRIIIPNKTLVLNSPNGGEVWKTGTTQYINWSFSNIDSLTIEYSVDGGMNWIMLEEKVYSGANVYPWDEGYFEWVVPEIPSINCLIKITDYFYPTIFDISDNEFIIEKYPLIYISILGNDEYGNGSIENPYRTIQKGIDSGDHMDSIRISYGEFNESIVFTLDKGYYISGGYHQTTWIRNLESGSTIINAAGGYGIQLPKSFLVLDGISITNSSTALYKGTNAHPLRLVLNNVHIYGVNRVFFAGNQPHSLFLSNSYFQDCLDGFYIRNLTNDLEISNSLFRNVNNNCIYNFNPGNELRNLKIVNNTFVSNQTAINLASSVLKNDLIQNNIFVSNATAITNNYNSILQTRHNLFYSNVADTINVPEDSTNLFGLDPNFIDYENGNFRLQDFSPCIGAGQPNELTTDLDGNLRPNPEGSNPDIGAYENPLGEPFAGIMTVLKTNIEGAYISGSMTSALSLAGYIPLEQPYSNPPFSHQGTETVTEIPMGVVDWVLVELRSGLTSNTKVSSRAGFLMSDGTITDLDGMSPLRFSSIGTGDYYTVIYHRNHLAIMSSNPVNFIEGQVSNYDFTDSPTKAYGSNAMKDLGSGKYGMYSGDGDADGNVDYGNDVLIQWLPNFGLDGYHGSDYDMDGSVDYGDDLLEKWLPNFGYSSQVPGETVIAKPKLKQEEIELELRRLKKIIDEKID